MIKIVTVAQHGPERSAFNRVVGGSNPPRDTLGTWYNGYYAIIFRDCRDAGSSPAGPTSSIAQLAERSAVNR